jgi:DNA-binding transcriptional ArsR family regulator
MSRSRDVDAVALARLASLLADTTRAGICLALLDGRAWTAGELAKLTGVCASTASEHLDRLVGGGLLAEERQGRHRYLRLAGPQVAQLVEDLGGHTAPAAGQQPLQSRQARQRPSLQSPQSPQSLQSPRSLRAVGASEALARGRTCYDHLAGRLGVALLDAMAERGLLETSTGIALTWSGLAWLDDLGIDVDGLRSGRRPLARTCLDWTERRPHLAGAAGAALCTRFVELGWVSRSRRPRAVDVTPLGRRELGRHLGGAEPWSATEPSLAAAAGGR